MSVAFYMVEDKHNRIVSYKWTPQRQGELGTLYYTTRDEPGDVWGQPKLVVDDIPLDRARATLREWGFAFEEASTDA